MERRTKGSPSSWEMAIQGALEFTLSIRSADDEAQTVAMAITQAGRISIIEPSCEVKHQPPRHVLICLMSPAAVDPFLYLTVSLFRPNHRVCPPLNFARFLARYLPSIVDRDFRYSSPH